MGYTRYHQDYRKNQILTADPGTILVMLYGGAIDFLRRAKSSLESGDVAEKGKFVLKTTAIITELQATLDLKAGGELAQNLEALYVYMLDQITNANRYNDPKPLEVVISLLSTLKKGWEGAVAAERERAMEVSV